MAEKKEIMKYGVKKDKIQIRVDTYKRLLEEDLATETKSGLNVLRIQLEKILEQIVEAENNSASPDVLADLELKRKEIEDKYNTLSSQSKAIFEESCKKILECRTPIRDCEDPNSIKEREEFAAKIQELLGD